jgi:hypothetical protein
MSSTFKRNGLTSEWYLRRASTEKHQRRNGDDSPGRGNHRRSVVSNGSTLIADPLLRGTARRDDSRLACSPSEFPHDPQHCGAEGWAFNRDYLSVGILFNLSNRTDRFEGRERATHDVRSLIPSDFDHHVG